MPALRKYPSELRERAVRLVAEARKEDPELSLNAAVVRIGQRVGVNADTLRGWCKQAAIDAGERPGTTTSEAERITMQRELLDRSTWTSKAELSSAMFEWIEGFYNPTRRHTALGTLSPVEFERLHATPAAAA
ncbi:MAG: transposase [Micrococcales bacterium]|nr:transposase [Micrococcales bacterium]